ncbi:hypothetical protein GCM10010168_54770 [Actinoplanes ianthinogenes]|uniref:Uncharacterized protein n=1 Tax=Actinoplanes ianthinogenes TaxID=122358 RepID=A0ABN6CAA8_9ACTN|nr:hypothetical protein [Actinoplanes ianthinogenes]BCJ41524.1 hypothetical protein Aiant_21810 [Actinoplanes ianthinogenes]GGR29524.1 hypothetical protein GCM10010168_54770 [Actinoplanes ianthinogenes]
MAKAARNVAPVRFPAARVPVSGALAVRALASAVPVAPVVRVAPVV